MADLKLQFDVAKLQALAKALDAVDAAVKALPTPSAVRKGGIQDVAGYSALVDPWGKLGVKGR